METPPPPLTPPPFTHLLTAPPAAGHTTPVPVSSQPLLYSLYTNNCTSTNPSVGLKFAGDATLIVLIRTGDESTYRQEVTQLASWVQSEQHAVQHIWVKQVKMDGWIIVDFRKVPPPCHLQWPTEDVQCFLRQLKKFNLSWALMVQFYTAIIKSILTSSITVWFSPSTKQDVHRLQHIIRLSERTAGCSFTPTDKLFTSRTRKRVDKIMSDP
ncbi:hypothetical protein LDENG_00288770 [Lucifuga dentata]|nr:hypothetical protein LDENG_00288770 [Lucifuga dentata]